MYVHVVKVNQLKLLRNMERLYKYKFIRRFLRGTWYCNRYEVLGIHIYRWERKVAVSKKCIYMTHESYGKKG